MDDQREKLPEHCHHHHKSQVRPHQIDKYDIILYIGIAIISLIIFIIRYYYPSGIVRRLAGFRY